METHDAQAWLRERFQERFISRKCNVDWALHSPELNSFLYVGDLKDPPKPWNDWWTEGSNLSKNLGNPPNCNEFELLTILHDVLKFATNTVEPIESIFWKEHLMQSE